MSTRNLEVQHDFGQSDGDWVIDNGWDVYGSDGEKVGAVEEVQPQYVVIGKGLIFHTERYVPVSAIASVENERVHLNIASQEIDRQGWDQLPDVETDLTAADSATADDVSPEPRDRLVNESEHLRLPLAEEELDAQTREVDRGAVHVHKDVIVETQAVDTPLREEELRVQRYRVEREYATAEIPADAFQELEIQIPIRGEDVTISKRSVVREEVDISKVVRERSHQVTETVRREEIDLSRVAGEE
jgi:uncharacterized protein (TIGR02271 family)